MRGIDAALAYHEANASWHEKERKYKRKRGSEHKPNRVSSSGQRYRTKKLDPPCAVVEQAILPRLLSLSANAMRLYCVLCRFANKHTGFAYPSKSRLMHRLGLVPYHTNALSGKVKVGLTKAQRATRKFQIDRFALKLEETIEELIAANVIDVGTTPLKQADGALRNVPGYYILNSNGFRRRLRDLKFSHATFVIQGWMFDIGLFAIRTQSKRSGFEPVSDLCIPILLLTLRDNDHLRFGGIDPKKIHLLEGELVIPRDGWPSEIPYSISQIETVIAGLIERKVISVHRGIFSRTYGQLIYPGNRPLIDGADEVLLAVFKFR